MFYLFQQAHSYFFLPTERIYPFVTKVRALKFEVHFSTAEILPSSHLLHSNILSSLTLFQQAFENAGSKVTPFKLVDRQAP